MHPLVSTQPPRIDLGSLPPAQRRFVRRLAKGDTVEVAAAKAGACRRTGYNWLKRLRELQGRDE